MTTTPDPFPWETPAEPTMYEGKSDRDHALEQFAEAPGEIEVARQGILDLAQAADFLDTLGADTMLLSSTVGDLKGTLSVVLGDRAEARKVARVAAVGDDKITKTDLRGELVGAAGDSEVLDAIGDAFKSSAKTARHYAGEALSELPGRGGNPARSTKVADGQGFELTVKVEAARKETSVKVDDVIDVLVAHLVGAERSPDTSENARRAEYATGARDGIAAYAELQSANPGWKVTAFDALVKRLEDAGEDPLAKRLSKAYGRVEKGEETVKFDRTPLAPEKTEAES